MKKLAIALGLIIMASGAMAQGTTEEVKAKKEQKSPEDIAKRKVERLTKELELTDKQAKIIHSKLVVDIKEAREMKERHRKLKEKMRAEMKEHKQNSTNRLKAELNQAQVEKLDAMIEQRKEKMEEKRAKKKAMMKEFKGKKELREDVKE